jgi:cysteinyl-tRNA synthetase
MALKLYNTRTRRKEVFEPLDPKAVRMYVCGPTVYDFAHIGNARPVIVFDVLFRLLRHLYGADRVTYVRNITDVDDKINARAAEEGVSIRELTERTAAQFHADVAKLGALPPTVEPRATEHIPEMIAMIQRLIERGHAYAAEGHVLFNVPSDPHYGELARRSTDEMRAGARIEIAPYKRDPMDFVLWKPSAGSEPGWDSPWGYGRPGWHLECSAMSEKHLGKVFDIHGGGIDLLFPHHENEVAQSTCAHGTEIMANVWMHNGHLQVEGQKMSKSLGNFVTIHDLLANWHGFGWPGEALRFNMLRTHYRQPLDWTAESLDEAHKTLWDWYTLIGEPPSNSQPSSRVLEELLDDLNLPAAIAAMHRLRRDNDLGSLAASLKFLGFSCDKKNLERRLPPVVDSGAQDAAIQVIQQGIQQQTKQHPAFRSGFFEPVTISDRNSVQELVDRRLAARKARNWAEADRIRDELSAMGIALKDAKNPVTGEIETTWEVSR